MASNQELKLSLLPFPQRWEKGTLYLNVVVLPRGNPLFPLMTGIPSVPDSPAFADSKLNIKAMIISGLEEMPKPANVTLTKDLGLSPPKDMRNLYEILNNSYDISLHGRFIRNPRRSGRQIKKLLVPSYCNAFAFSGPKTEFAKLDDSYACALFDPSRLKKPPGPHPTRRVVWGRIIAQALRQPVLAKKLGLLYEAKIDLSESFLKDGGWIYLDLDGSSHFAAQAAAKPEWLGRYSARIPPIEGDLRPIFAAVLFPVTDSLPAGNFDELLAEVASYDDGFAKIVHCAQQTTFDLVGLEKKTYSQPAFTDSGIMLGWDDEQVLIWLNRQIADPANETRGSPLGVMGYRVDVRETVGSDAYESGKDELELPAKWTSLMWAEADLVISPDKSLMASGSLINPHPIGKTKRELTIETKPLQLDNEDSGDYWLPTYFAQWYGRSLAASDALAMSLSGTKNADINGMYKPIGGDDVPLRYGRRYEFRVRLADISGGGPVQEYHPINPSPAPIAECHFRRYIQPREVIINGRPACKDKTEFIAVDMPLDLEIARPNIGYPAAIFTGVANARDMLESDLKKITLASSGNKSGMPGIPDPDVESLEIYIQAASPENDPLNDYHGHPPLRKVYATARKFPLDPNAPIKLQLSGADEPQIEGPNWDTGSSKILVPTGRDVVITFKAVCREDAKLEYFGHDDFRIGRSTDIRLRFSSKDERKFFADDSESNRLRCIFMQQDEATTAGLLTQLAAMGKGEEAETDIMSRLAAELGLTVNGMTLSGKPGKRTIFGCSGTIPHIIASDQSSITFSSKADLILRWISAINLKINRDWTWNNGGEPGAIQFKRFDEEIGSMRLPMIVNSSVFSERGDSKAVAGSGYNGGDNIDRSVTDVFFFDAVDPKTAIVNGFPDLMHITYTVKSQFRTEPDMDDGDLSLTVKLPVALPPGQTPKLASAGIALSPYSSSEDYSSTEVRKRFLWLEFDRPPADPGDTCFARMLSCAPDPMLTSGAEVTLPPEPPLPIDPEHIRVIFPDQPEDSSGLNAMQQLIPTDSPRHFLLPLPPDTNERSRELFGFFVYEFRIGHLTKWSLARARFGPSLRVTGVSHPAPPLNCATMRTAKSVRVSAEFATPVFNGRSLLPKLPATQMWMLLYAQVTQADGKSNRNLLLSRRMVSKESLLKGGQKPMPDYTGSVVWPQDEIEKILKAYSLPVTTPISAMAVELLPEMGFVKDPLGNDLGKVRILRASNLTRISGVCVPKPLPQQ